jgi:hypothetical protein
MGLTPKVTAIFWFFFEKLGDLGALAVQMLFLG